MESKLSPQSPDFFFSLLRKPAEQALRIAALVRIALKIAVFAAAKTSGRVRRCGGVPPRALTNKIAAGRWRSHRIREADRKRGMEDGEQACLQSRFQTSFSYSLLKQPNPRLVFGWGLGERNPPLPFGR